MDAETSRLVLVAAISAGAAIIAGLGGAILTAWINRKNTKDTLTAARQDNEKRWQLQVDREHEVWLRDAKQKSYAKFLSTVTAAASNSFIADASYPMNTLMAYDEVRLIGPPEIRNAANQIKQQILMNAGLNQDRCQMLPEADANSAELEEVEGKLTNGIGNLKKMTHSFATLARKDTGAEPRQPGLGLDPVSTGI
ncbi:hypothetical protein [Arthrobacter sp. UYEF36]|uniref:hypothetical protein n=1 Tax=Arthrobacter sp. UYEF36 TaxID=1756366 RepID=UPI003396759F